MDDHHAHHGGITQQCDTPDLNGQSRICGIASTAHCFFSCKRDSCQPRSKGVEIGQDLTIRKRLITGTWLAMSYREMGGKRRLMCLGLSHESRYLDQNKMIKGVRMCGCRTGSSRDLVHARELIESLCTSPSRTFRFERARAHPLFTTNVTLWSRLPALCSSTPKSHQ